MRITKSLLQVLAVFYNNPSQSFAGSEIHRLTKMSNGSIYPILCRLEQNGWLESKWEEINPSKVGRPRKRLYCLTRTGSNKAKAEFEFLKSLGDKEDYGLVRICN